MMKNNPELPITEEIDFHYLLTLLPPLHDIPEFAWLPELFSTIGLNRLIKLCQHAGGETITIPTIQTLSNSIEALQWFYDVHIKKSKQVSEIPLNLLPTVQRVKYIYVRDSKA